ncbi:hypothetical protein RvY_14965-2 [Ramazzottius varieornatus]|uniref:Uncharacterized protein n=1 Tax=Ramazzottius varieornatus TaxID=947166 RepID=A0A1D1VUM2_RAMVA|nr:hypothetical protein RvY_14965-2 [Ramazzottius varieornatus]
MKLRLIVDWRNISNFLISCGNFLIFYHSRLVLLLKLSFSVQKQQFPRHRSAYRRWREDLTSKVPVGADDGTERCRSADSQSTPFISFLPAGPLHFSKIPQHLMLQLLSFLPVAFTTYALSKVSLQRKVFCGAAVLCHSQEWNTDVRCAVSHSGTSFHSRRQGRFFRK